MSFASLRPRSYYPAWTRLATRWHDNDRYGHVNNVVFYAWFDTAVNEWLIAKGLLSQEGEGPIGLVVASGCSYAAPLAFPQPVEVGIAIARVGRSSVTYHIGVFAEGSAEAAAEGFFTHVYVVGPDRRPTPVPPVWREAMALIAARSG
jgi:acyl-CoA thioester hydrolase